jgi:acetyl esterase/lipase
MGRWWIAALAAVSMWGQAPKAKGPEVPRPDFADVVYGPHQRNRLDLWLAPGPGAKPLVVFIHGGGFVAGDKSQASAANIRRCLAAGVSFAAINYRYRTTAPIQTVLRDSARAIQFLRAHAEKYNLDKKRVASMGGSAGAGTSLWLAFHDDMANPADSDPVLRESTRISAAAATGTQATYDLLRWREVIGDAGMRFMNEADGPGFYGLKSMEELRSPAGAKIRADVDMLGLITKDDPPVYMVSARRQEKLENRGAALHSPLHAFAVKKRCDEAGVPAEVHVTEDTRGADAVGFLLRHLGAEK